MKSTKSYKWKIFLLQYCCLQPQKTGMTSISSSDRLPGIYESVFLSSRNCYCYFYTYLFPSQTCLLTALLATKFFLMFLQPIYSTHLCFHCAAYAVPASETTLYRVWFMKQPSNYYRLIFVILSNVLIFSYIMYVFH